MLQNHYDHFMLQEIMEIPARILDVKKYYLKNSEIITDFKQLISSAGSIHFIGCGTAWHSGLVAQHYFRRLINKNVFCHIASEFALNPACSRGDICLFISQSGETADTLAAFKEAKEKGAVCATLTNNTNSQLAFLCDYTIPVLAGAEISVASTKAYNCQVLVLIMLLYLATETKYDFNKNIKKLSQQIKNIDIMEIKNKSGIIDDNKKIFFMGRGADYVTALEASLKLKETSYINAAALPAGELKHGPLALVDKNTLAVVIITQKNSESKGINTIKELKSRGADVIAISPFEEVEKVCAEKDIFIKLEKTEETLYPLLSIVPLQLLAYFVSVGKGINPDKPRNLTKAVITE